MASGPITDVTTLKAVKPHVAKIIEKAAHITPQAAPQAPAAPEIASDIATSPGKERWPVKTGTDSDVALVGKNIIGGTDYGQGIVDATVEELITAPRPADMPVPTKIYDGPDFHAKRVNPAETPVEVTIWRVVATITAMKLEADGDYHLVLQGASGETMIGEIPTPTSQFVGNSPWLANIKAVRTAVDNKFTKNIQAANFVQMGNKLVPREAVTGPASPPPNAPQTFMPSAGPQAPAIQPFKTQLPATRARITGVGFFDSVHGQMGVSQSNGIELHPVLNIEFNFA